jgi:DNA-binding CsgD family transcriptional regulator
VLTPRQREIAALIAGGYSNAQIADRLVITRGTVANHLEQIMRRGSFRSRTQIGVWVSERGLYRPGDGCRQGDLPQLLPIRAAGAGPGDRARAAAVARP